MKYILLIFILTISPAIAEPTKGIEIEPILEVIYQKQMDFPTSIELKVSDGQVLRGAYYNQFISTDIVETWKVGELMTISYSSTKGLGVVRKKDGNFYKIYIDPDVHPHPYSNLENQCEKKYGYTTIATSSCEMKTAERWQVEQEYALNYLYDNASPELAASLKLSQDNWENYMSSFVDAHRICSGQRSCMGSRHTTGVSWARVKMESQRTETIMSYLYYMN